MKIFIMGCGRTGAKLATILDAEGHDITVLDVSEYSFRRLPVDFKGTALVGDGTNDETLKKAGIETIDAFVKVLLRIYDPLRRELYNKLGLEAFSPTIIFAELLKSNLLDRGQ